MNDISVNHLADDSEDGYKVHPESQHSRHSDYPLAPERLTIDETMLSSFQQKSKESIKQADIQFT